MTLAIILKAIERASDYWSEADEIQAEMPDFEEIELVDLEHYTNVTCVSVYTC